MAGLQICVAHKYWSYIGEKGEPDFITETVGFIVIASDGIIVAIVIVSHGCCVDNLAAAFFDQVKADEGVASLLSSVCRQCLRSVVVHCRPSCSFTPILPIHLPLVFVDWCVEWRTRLLSRPAPVVCGLCHHHCLALLPVVVNRHAIGRRRSLPSTPFPHLFISVACWLLCLALSQLCIIILALALPLLSLQPMTILSTWKWGQIVVIVSTSSSSLMKDWRAETCGRGLPIVYAAVLKDGGDHGLCSGGWGVNGFGSRWLKNWWSQYTFRLAARRWYMRGVTLRSIPLRLLHCPRCALCGSNKTFTDIFVKGWQSSSLGWCGRKGGRMSRSRMVALSVHCPLLFFTL